MEQPRLQDNCFEETDSFFDEKDQVNTSSSSRTDRKHHPKLGWFICFLLFATIYIWQPQIKNIYYKSSTPTISSFVEYENITPSEKLEWHQCRGTFYCARLTVPMDYNRPLNASKDNPKVHIALILARGQHKGINEYSVSPLLINPGGPGGSGTSAATYLAAALQTVVGLDQDIIGFDPRGIQSTTPRVDCFSEPYKTARSDAQYDFEAVNSLEGFYKRITWLMAGSQIGLINSSSSALPKLDVRDRTLGKLCQEKDALQGENSIYKHLHTPNVARDMLSIIDAWDEWRVSLNSGTISTDSKSLKEERESDYSLDTKGKLVYWGFSYGTLLGATFAAMFPDRIGRMVLDGVVDADFYVAPVWSKSIVNTDQIINSFPKYCHEGQEKCALYRPGDSISDIKSRFEDVQNSLRANPLSFVGLRTHSPIIITIDDLRSFFFAALYGPVMMFPMVAFVTDAVIREDYSILETLYHIPDRQFVCSTMPESNYPTDAQTAILCGDKRYPLNETTTNLLERFNHMSEHSTFADVWMTLMMGCDGWPIQTVDPPMRWGKHPIHRHDEKPINTSFPLLFLSNTYDPVTPLAAGVKMAGFFKDSGLVEQKSMGHCSISSVSICTMRKVKAYFREGIVPKHPALKEGGELKEGEWERCESDEWPFHPFQGEHWAEAEGEVRSEEVREQSMMVAVKEIQKVVGEHGFLRFGEKLGVTNVKGENGKCGAKY